MQGGLLRSSRHWVSVSLRQGLDQYGLRGYRRPRRRRWSGTAGEGVIVNPSRGRRLRFVTHHDVQPPISRRRVGASHAPFLQRSVHEDLSHRCHSRRRDRQGGGAGRYAGSGSCRPPVWLRAQMGRIRLELRDLRALGAHDAGRWPRPDHQARCDLSRGSRISGGSRSCLPVGIVDSDPTPVSSICKSQAGQTAGRRSMPAGGTSPWRYRFPYSARKQRRRIFRDRRPALWRHGPGNRHSGEHLQPPGSRSHSEICLRAGTTASEMSPHLGHQVERHHSHHALLGRTGRQRWPRPIRR